MSKYERLSRFMKIVTLIEAEQNLHRRELAERCEVSVRTIQRDINTLAYAGIPIFCSRDGYEVMPDFFMPPVNLSLEEVSSLVIASEMLSEYGGGSRQEALKSAMSKVIARLPDEMRHRLREALDTARLDGKEISQSLGEANEHIPEILRVLAGDVAHELNNILTAIVGNISIANMHARVEEVTDGTLKLLADAERASMQARNLAQQLLRIYSNGCDEHDMAESRAEVETSVCGPPPTFPETVPMKREEVSNGDVIDGVKILVMDDEKYIRDVICQMLNALGYRGVSTIDGAEAIGLYREAKESGQPYDTVILDLVVPCGMGGMETIQKLKQLDPEVKAIASSGYSNDPVMYHFERYGFRGALPKPYTVTELSAVLHEVIAG